MSEKPGLNRGGLWHFTYDVFTLFCLIEEEIRRHVTIACAGSHDGLKKDIIDRLTNNVDVQFQWCVLLAELDTSATVAFTT